MTFRDEQRSNLCRNATFSSKSCSNVANVHPYFLSFGRIMSRNIGDASPTNPRRNYRQTKRRLAE